MRILFIGPLPEPVTGHSLASKVFLDELMKYHHVEVVNLSKDSLIDGEASIKRIIEVMKILMDVWRKRVDADAIYLTISESFAGNIKDLFIYLICIRGISKMYIHLHGGSIRKLLFDRHKMLSGINKIFIEKLAGAIISGKSHINIFGGMIRQDKIHIVPNFAQDYLFLTEKEIAQKYSNTRPLKILYIGGLMEKKGYNELADAYFGLDKFQRQSIRIDFAGKFESESRKKMFLEKIAGAEQIRYHGIVSDAEKKLLFSQAHIFCLPTSFFEGQPISILEAYASGCVVLTTGQSGIRDIFTDGVNGFEVQERSSDSIRLVLEKILENPENLENPVNLENLENLLEIAIYNRNMAAEKYRTSTYSSSLREIIESQVTGLECSGCR